MLFQINCEFQPWIIEPSSGKFLYVKVRGIFIEKDLITYEDVVNNASIASKTPKCETKNRILIYSGRSVYAVVCPQPSGADKHRSAEVFSEGWVINEAEHTPESLLMVMDAEKKNRILRARNVIVEYLGKEKGSYKVNWLELSRRWVGEASLKLGAQANVPNFFFRLQKTSSSAGRLRNERLLPPLPGAGRLHQLLTLVRRRFPLSFRIRRVYSSLLRNISAARSVPGFRCHWNDLPFMCRMHSSLPVLSEAGEKASVSPQDASVRLIRFRRQGSDLLTQRWFCSVR